MKRGNLGFLLFISPTRLIGKVLTCQWPNDGPKNEQVVLEHPQKLMKELNESNLQ